MKAMIAGLAVSCAAGMALANSTSLTYECERGARIMATYLNVSDGSYVVLLAEGRQVALQAQTSSAGLRYVSLDEKAPYIWWTKDAEGELFVKMGATDIPVLSECVEAR